MSTGSCAGLSLQDWEGGGLKCTTTKIFTPFSLRGGWVFHLRSRLVAQADCHSVVMAQQLVGVQECHDVIKTLGDG